jgi:hypothetical protein
VTLSMTAQATVKWSGTHGKTTVELGRDGTILVQHGPWSLSDKTHLRQVADLFATSGLPPHSVTRKRYPVAVIAGREHDLVAHARARVLCPDRLSPHCNRTS